MKLLYITQRANEEGGVQRVLSIKTNYLIEKFGYEIAIVTQNQGNENLFFEFNDKINFHDITLNNVKVFNLFRYKKELKKYIKEFQPDCIIVCDFALKSFSIPLLLHTNVPMIFEAHGSRFNEYKESRFLGLRNTLKYKYRNYCASKFLFFVALSEESLKEWTLFNGILISNPLWLETTTWANLKETKIIAVARHSYEKGIDRLLQIWQVVVQKHPDWLLEIYGKIDKDLELQNIVKKFDIESNIRFLNPVKNIEEKYKEASLLVMTSRNEALPMVLLEAMACGLPCIAYDCPVGPKAIIRDNENGFLIEDGNKDSFVEKLNLLIEDENLRIEMGKKAIESVEKYDLESIMNQWKNLFESIVKN
ncbi:glycosyltransferase family 4 protein [Flavobacterium sp. Fl-77]|uniref:Glycosyltransferase family 4 protein n=1 Tax=Flavobacterium flavipigmentatum TaxID=2893884 RepID=A0AAJ2SAY7_9FLAO|nr:MULTISPECIES: glycosyltransferase family 4 protein [unclassified Flavobacterium]MDX6181900.1 glycosyltransferase family 4 protein [Flavobacterium sp. Fl-33]MDX6185066.1 glycosyltransferase family 4 protein [Flavobacterium sp. Fl-77]UFH37176.1 glycosyltransferase family 4 protein [Flavobacterium sp. F-70]